MNIDYYKFLCLIGFTTCLIFIMVSAAKAGEKRVLTPAPAPSLLSCPPCPPCSGFPHIKGRPVDAEDDGAEHQRR